MAWKTLTEFLSLATPVPGIYTKCNAGKRHLTLKILARHNLTHVFFSRPKTYLEAKLISEGAFGSYLVRIAVCDWAGTGLCTLEPHGV